MPQPFRLFAPRLICSALASLLAAGAAAQSAAPPNVVLLVADDLGYGDLGSYGGPDVRTPHLDALAARGLRFTDFYAGGPVCTPSRYALLTGLHAFRDGDAHLLTPIQNTTSGISQEVTTVAEALRVEGYETALIGKWHLGRGEMHLGERDTEFHPLHHGFDSFFGPLGGSIDYNTHWVWADFLDWWEDRQPRHQDSLLYATHVFGDRAVAFLDAHRGAGTTRPPFLLYLPVTAPHAGQTVDNSPLAQLQLPLGREREYLSRFDDLYPDDANVRKRHLAMVAVLDDEVGRIVDALNRNGLDRNTVVWFLSDNGGALRYGGSNGAFRGDKGDPYEGGIRVPSFVVWPGRIAPGVSGQVLGNVDVLPTLLAFAGAAPPAPVDGLDLSGHLLGGPPVERGIAVPNSVLGDAYRLRRWKYVHHPRADGPALPELYDLAVDPGERTDLATVYPDTLALLRSLMPYDGHIALSAAALNSPVVQGSHLRVEVYLTNMTATPHTGDLRLDVEGPGGVTATTPLLTGGTLGAQHGISQTFRVSVPPNAPVGGYIGTVDVIRGGGGVVASAGFSFDVVAGASPEAHGIATAEGGGLAFEHLPVVGPSVRAEARVPVPAAGASPNPAAASAALTFALAAPAEVRLTLYDVLGRAVASVEAGALEAGAHRLALDLSALPAGVYVWRLAAAERVETGRLTVAR